MNIATEFFHTRAHEPQQAIELLSYGLPSEKVETYVKMIRSSGRAVHSAYAHSLDALKKQVENSDVHIILAALGDNDIDFETLNRLSGQLRDVTAVIGFDPTGGYDPLPPLSPIRDLVIDDGRAPQVILREYDSLMTRRRLREAERRLQESEHRCDALMESSKEAIAYVHQGMHARANAVYLEMFKVEDAEALDGHPLMDLVAKEQRAELRRLLNITDFSEEGARYLDATCRSVDGETFDARIEFTGASIDGEPCTQIIVRRDTLSEELEHFKRLANRDPHTGLYHRAYFLSAVETVIPKLYSDADRQYAMMFLAVDGFSEIRDVHGFDAAEGLLKETAEVLAESAGKEVLLSRFGDACFSMLWKVGATADVEDLATRFRGAIGSHAYTSLKQFVTPTLSIGFMASRQARVSTTQEFVNRAYKAFQTAIAKGGDRVVAYDPKRDDDPQTGGSSTDSAAIEMLEFAISHSRMMVHYEPMVSTAGDAVEHFAANLSVRDVDESEVPAREFVRSAQAAGKLESIDRWVIEQCLAELVNTAARGKNAILHIPVTPAAFHDERLLSWLLGELNVRKLRPDQITVVIASSDIKEHLDRVRMFSVALYKMGCRVAIDEFEATEKDFTLLKHLPAVSGIRFPEPFAGEMERDRSIAGMLHDAVNRLHAAGCTAGLSSIGTAAGLAQAWGLGVDFVQGGFLSPPLDHASFDFSQY